MRKSIVWAVVVFSSFVFWGCGPSRSMRIGDTFEPLHKPKFDYAVAENAKGFVGYSVGILQPEFIEKKADKKNVWVFGTPQEKQYVADLKREVSNILEKILIAKGNKVAGPFGSYQEMTYPERERCTFLIQPTFIIDLETSQEHSTILKQVGGPNLEAFAYAEVSGQIIGNIQMEYVILDPLTQEKLERHKLNSEDVTVDFKSLYQGSYDKDGKPVNFMPLNVFAEKYNRSLVQYYSNYHNSDNASAKILELAYQKFIPQMDKLISVEEFNHLKQYQDTLKEKKRY